MGIKKKKNTQVVTNGTIDCYKVLHIKFELLKP